MIGIFACSSDKKLLSHRSWVPLSKPKKCNKIGDSKIKNYKASRKLKKQLAERSSRQEGGNAVASVKTNQTTTVSSGSSSGTVSSESTSSTTSTSAALASSEEDHVADIISMDDVITSDSIEIDEVSEVSSGTSWFSSDKAEGIVLDDLFFVNDDDPPSPEEMKVLEEAVDYLRFGYSIKLTEYLKHEDVTNGKHVPYKRVNRLKTKLITMGVSPDLIFFESKTLSAAELPKQKVGVEMVDE